MTSQRTYPRWEAIEIGDELPTRIEPPLRITDFVIYQGAANDQNPMHHDTEFALSSGYEGPFAVGMLAAGILADVAVSHFGAENIRRYRAQFREQAWPKDVITYSGTVVAKHIEGTEQIVDVELAATRQTGGVHVQGTASFVVEI
jgi:acyl dehydratase